MLKDINFLKRIQEVSTTYRDNINDETLELLVPYQRGKSSWFSEERAEKTGQAIVGLWRWCWAMVLYTEKAKVVRPRRMRLKIMEGKLTVA